MLPRCSESTRTHHAANKPKQQPRHVSISRSELTPLQSSKQLAMFLGRGTGNQRRGTRAGEPREQKRKRRNNSQFGTKFTQSTANRAEGQRNKEMIKTISGRRIEGRRSRSRRRPGRCRMGRGLCSLRLCILSICRWISSLRSRFNVLICATL
jgi:hypothetical protein